jgi:hypothetical protein
MRSSPDAQTIFYSRADRQSGSERLGRSHRPSRPRSGIPKGDIFPIACAWLPDHDLTDLARDYGLTNLAPICDGDPTLPDPPPTNP